VIDEIFIALQAKDLAANRLRSWQIEADPDLFGVWVMTVRFGRIGTAGGLPFCVGGKDAILRPRGAATPPHRQTPYRGRLSSDRGVA
jgi:hypothetical protein